MSEPVLEVRDLRTSFATRRGKLTAVDGLDLALYAGETLCVVGESGCGKSVTALSILRLLPEPPARIESGRVLFEGRDLLRESPEALRELRGNRIAMIFQEPMTSLNPVFTIGDQIEEAIRVHRDLSRAERQARVVELLELVGIPEPRARMRDYPHQLSGGMRQRVMIAMSLANDPAVLIADEPTTALDVTIQAQILELLDSLKRRFQMAVLLITHDLGVVAETGQRVAVLYAARVVETGTVEQIFAAPQHPYTRGLLDSLPSARVPPGEPLHVIKGRVPELVHRPKGCSFRPRCPRALEVCAEIDPLLAPGRGGGGVACHNPVPAPGAAS
ncbi:MAG TPA: ABC transporter ATP-binding protein [Myxococcota bacterium]|nr:ABC transporter ATP-binding protein [Myxococcota bacterium]